VQEQSGREMILIGGGAGIAPLRSMILDQLARGSTRRMSFWYGARNRLELCYADEFDALAARHPNFTWHVALSAAGNDAPWGGYTGFIHKVLYEAYLKDHPAPEDAEYYLCGPPLMSAAVVRVLDEVGVDAANVFYDDFGA
jgi:Na+-transporting NADH:ubiquinone oxidoreductase subunit F